MGRGARARCATTTTPSGACPSRGEQGLFERLCLEGFQAGLSWSTILNKRDRFREVFHGFDVDRVAAMTDADVERLLTDTGIVRNRAKVEATRKNAAATIALRDDGGLEAFIEQFRPEHDPEPRVPAEVPDDLTGVGRPVQGAAQAGLRLRRPDHDARPDGGDRPGRHPPGRLPPARGSRAVGLSVSPVDRGTCA